MKTKKTKKRQDPLEGLVQAVNKVGPGRIKLVHGEPDARAGLESALRPSLPGISVEAACSYEAGGW